VFARFHEESTAEEALKILENIRRQSVLDFDDAAVIRRDSNGSLQEVYTMKETADTSTGKGAGIGAIIGSVVGLRAGPVGVVFGAGAGSVIGGWRPKAMRAAKMGGWRPSDGRWRMARPSYLRQ